ncbi:hypothetical protein P691DRAFT_812796, partial [Macrolepiota fuliginosa MF-IS2]
LGLAHDVPDSTSSLSWPYTNELVNSVLKAWVYDWAFETCFDFDRFPEIERQLLQRFGRTDFRKAQQNEAILYAGHSGFMRVARWNCRGPLKVTHGAQLFRVPPDQFQTRFDVVEFKAAIKRWEECGIIQPYYPI